MLHRPNLFAIAIVLIASPSWQAAAETGAALVLEADGGIEPETRDYTEIETGTTLTLEADARVLFLHYNTCRTVEVVGGRISFGERDFYVNGGKVTRVERASCPREIQVAGTGTFAGTVLRAGAGKALKLPTTPSIVLVGRRANDFGTIRFIKEGTVVLEASLAGNRFRWPEEGAPLESGGHYELELIPLGPDAEPVKLELTAADAGLMGSAGALNLIRVD